MPKFRLTSNFEKRLKSFVSSKQFSEKGAEFKVITGYITQIKLNIKLKTLYLKSLVYREIISQIKKIL